MDRECVIERCELSLDEGAGPTLDRRDFNSSNIIDSPDILPIPLMHREIISGCE